MGWWGGGGDQTGKWQIFGKIDGNPDHSLELPRGWRTSASSTMTAQTADESKGRLHFYQFSAKIYSKKIADFSAVHWKVFPKDLLLYNVEL